MPTAGPFTAATVSLGKSFKARMKVAAGECAIWTPGAVWRGLGGWGLVRELRCWRLLGGSGSRASAAARADRTEPNMCAKITHIYILHNLIKSTHVRTGAPRVVRQVRPGGEVVPRARQHQAGHALVGGGAVDGLGQLLILC